MSQHHVNPDLIHRTAQETRCGMLHRLNITGLCLARQYHYGADMATIPFLSACCSGHLRDIHAATLAMPLRMPMTLSLDDPSRDRKVRKYHKLRWPTCFQYEADETFPARGIFMSVTAVSTISVVSSVSMDDLTRHVMFLPPPVAVKQKPPLLAAQPALLGKRLYLC